MYRTSFIILYSDQQMQNYFTNYHNPTCFDTIVSFWGSLYPCQVTQEFQMQLLVIIFTIKIFYFVLWPIIAQLFHNLSHSYIFRHYRVIVKEFVIIPARAQAGPQAQGGTHPPYRFMQRGAGVP